MVFGSDVLKKKIKGMDHRGYPGYKELRGQYDFGRYVLSIDHVQGDPFASPSHLSIRVKGDVAGFPPAYYKERTNRITLQDHLTRLFGKAVTPYDGKAKGSGKSGHLNTSRCGQQVLERSACQIQSDGSVILRLTAGFPAQGRSILASSLIQMLFEYLPAAIDKSLYYASINQDALRRAIELCEDQQAIRAALVQQGLCAFIADGAILPRESGVSDHPLKQAVRFQSPASLRVTLTLPHKGTITGMGIAKGITLFVGGGYHGKSTLLQALEMGVYDHITGDGREYVITDASAWKLRAEDGRSISNVDISAFINHLPNQKDTVHFSTENASGSTSQAANLMESIEAGSKLLLIDEDTSATNFMIRDELMQQVICREEEPITPFIEHVRSLYTDRGVSSIIVAGSSGAFFQIADTIIQMKEYIPYDITVKAKDAAASYPALQTSPHFPAAEISRAPKPNLSLRKESRLKLKTSGTNELLLGRDPIELRYIEQLADSEQTQALAYVMKYLQLHRIDGKTTVPALLDHLMQQLDAQGPDSLFDHECARTGLAIPRRQEIAACLNRYRKLFF